MPDIGEGMRFKIGDMISWIAVFEKKDWEIFNEALRVRLEQYGKGKKNLEFFQSIMNSYQNAIEKLV